jgi:NAD+ kinase
MPLPIDLVLVRHGESEGNIANKRDRNGDSSLLTPEHRNRHNSTWRLTDLGVKQAKSAGNWILENIHGQFDHCLVSAYVRARETAGYLGLPGVEWEIDPYLIERDHGDLDGMTQAQKDKKFGDNLARRAMQEFYWRPPNGETRLDAGLRWDRIMHSLSDRHHDHRVIIVAHETLIEAGMIRRLHWTVEEFCKWKESNDEATKIHNCQIIHFSRRDPISGTIHEGVRWWRTVCPWDLSITDGSWQPILKRRFTNDELLKQASEYERLIV